MTVWRRWCWLESTIINCINWYTDQSTFGQIIGTSKRRAQHAGCLLPSRWHREGKNKCVMKSLVCWGWWIIEPSGGTQWQTGRNECVLWVCPDSVTARLNPRSSVIYMRARALLTSSFNFQIFNVWILDWKKMCSVVTEQLWSWCPADRILYCHLAASNRNWINSTLSKDNTHIALCSM